MTTARHLRVSDAERQAAASRIGAAWAEGRLDDAEYDRRLTQAFAAVTYADLDQLFTDLPGPRPVAPPPPAPAYRSMPSVPRAVQRWSPAGHVRSTALQVLLFVVTFGLWGYVYLFLTHDEMKRNTGEGVGGVLALLLAVLFWMASPFLLSHEVGRLYERRGLRRPVSGLTGLWFFPGILILVGPLIWFVLTNRALNDHWRGLGAR